MKAKTKLTKLWSFLLSLVMLLSLVPAMGVTALAAGSYPDANEVCVDDGKYFAEPGKLYYKNGDAANNFTGSESNYNAHYDPNTGTLTLDGYDGGSITAGGPKSKITVVLKGTNTINGNLVNSRGGDITITSESGGTLSITNTLSGSYSAIGIEAGYSSSYTTGNVTVKGDAKVTINMTHNGTNGYDNAYGIYAKENITISENASVDITCATPNNTYSNIYCNGLRADKNVTINTDGTIKINVIAAGDDGTQSYGIYPMGNATLTKVGEMEVQWKKHKTNTSYPGGAIFGSATFSDTDHAINVDETNCYASYRFGQPYTVTVQNGTVTGPGVPNASGSGKFLAGDKVNITPAIKKSWDDQVIPFKEWTSSDVTLDKSATTASNSFTVPGKDVTVTAKHSPFVGTPTFTPTGTTGTEGTLTFKTVVKADETYEGFRLVKEGNENNESSYISIRSDTTSTSSPYEYSYETRRLPGVNQVDEGNYYVVAYLNNDYYLSEKFTVDYTAAPTTYTVSFDANGGTGTMADVTGVSGTYTLPACGFAAPADKQFKGWATSADGTAIPGTTIDVTADTTLYAIWENIPVTEHAITVTNGKATVGAGTEISKAAEGTTVTLTANAASDGQMFDKWEVVSGSITLADETSETTTFVMPAGAVSVKATYKAAPHTHTFDQEIVKDAALKTAADCTHDAVYYKSCECGKIGDASTAGTFEYEDSALGHDWSEGWSKDADNHWHECNRCHEKKDNAAHGYKSGVCTVCGAKDPDYKPPVNPFVDVSESSVYYDAILWAYYHEPQQITGGYTATEFRPGNPCTRGQVVTFLWRAAGCPEPTGDTSMFKDASSIAAPYQKAVAWAVEKGITTGFADGTFRPNDSVTRAQFVTFLWRYENRPATSGSIAGFTDAASIAEPYQQAVAWAVEKGITTGYNDGSFRPNATCTRWAVVLFMYRDMT